MPFLYDSITFTANPRVIGFCRVGSSRTPTLGFIRFHTDNNNNNSRIYIAQN